MTRLRTTAPLLVAAGLAALAVVTVRTAGCDEPAHYALLPDGGSVLVGGCIEPGDLIVPPSPAPPAAAPEAPVPSRS
ncbi:hypothetical protein L7F22_037187 [Adiantum nelumboides]|uniref:Uncharacterized protein n=1 Tax=Pseudonocardia sediminis TaxID=1397368 RepID=A0A4Q7UV91_PSEST|nr:hypothetical protein [Pseudonocardia sediminis]MCO5583278.1 hypothetical protein [Adiantum nelumboides]RZT83983.1 hypothetical protein EV383_0816 [Pseudonocardia sediminis]